MNQAFHLYRLQQIDSQMDKVRASVAEIDRRLANNTSVLQAQHGLETASKVFHQASQNLKAAEFAVRESQVKINQCESTLYSGKVRNPKELQDLQKEIVSLKKHLATLEDQQLDAMMAAEDAEKSDSECRAALDQAQAAFTEQSAGWLGQRGQLQHQLDRLLTERQTAVSPVSSDDLQTYETIRKRKSGVAVSIVHEGSCSVCGASIRPAELQAIRTAQTFMYCDSCGRILYAG